MSFVTEQSSSPPVGEVPAQGAARTPFNIALGPRVRKSPYYDATVNAGVTFFSIYNHMYMPVTYGDAEGEYWRLIKGVSMWDVAAERQVQVQGPDTERLVRYLTPRDLSNWRTGVARYAPMCDHSGAMINDPVVLKLQDGRVWFSIADTDMIYWVKAVAAEGGFDVEVSEPDVSPLAVQGPLAVEVIAALFGESGRALRHFRFMETRLHDIPVVVARTGWSKQDGFELFLQDGSKGLDLWDLVAAAGEPYGIGPGAPNYTERVESALLSFGGDNERDSSPFEFDLGRFVSLDRDDDFIGKAALKRIAETGPPRRQVGLFLDGPRISWNEHPWVVQDGSEAVGKATVAAYSFRLERNIALALLKVAALDGKEFTVETPSGPCRAVVTDLPFC